MEVSRVKRSEKNIAVGMVCVFCNALFTFVTTSVFIRLLGAELNGVNRLFSNILQVLSLADLGFASAVAYLLYKPLQEGDRQSTAALMNYFAKVYRVIAFIVLVAGVLCIPFLQYLINEDINELSFSLNRLRSFFALYLLNTVSSYLLAYKRTILTADQNNYVVSLVDNTGSIVFSIIQIVVLVLTHNYYLYLTTLVAKTVINNVIITVIANKKYPYLKEYKKVSITDKEKKELVQNVKAMFCHKVGSVAVYSTSTIIISAFVSVVDAGKYGNYILIVNQISVFIGIVFSSLTSSIGNLCVDSDLDYQMVVFNRVRYLSDFIVIFTAVCYNVLFNDFISLWVGAGYTFPIYITLMISVNAASPYLRSSINAFKEAKGLFKKDWFKPLLEAVCGMALAIVFCHFWGIFGVVLGYFISSVFIAMPIEDYVLFKYGFKAIAIPCYIRQLIVLIIASSVAVGLGYILNFPFGILWFILKALIAVSIVVLGYIVCTFKKQEFGYYKTLLKNKITSVRRKT